MIHIIVPEQTAPPANMEVFKVLQVLYNCSVVLCISHFKNRIDDQWLDRANHIAGLLLMVFGVLIYLKLAADLLL